LHSYDCFYNVINLNYDTIFESAVMYSGLSHNYFPPNNPRTIPIAKVHGSVNWLNPIGRGVANPSLSKPNDILRFASSLLYSNRFNMDPIRVLDFVTLSKLKLKDLFRSGADYDEPVLIPPIGNHKDYEKVPLYQQIWNFAARMLKEATELVIIGTALRKEDTKLVELLKNNVGPSTKIIIVGNKSKIVQGLESITERKLQEPIGHFPRFIDYAKSL